MSKASEGAAYLRKLMDRPTPSAVVDWPGHTGGGSSVDKVRIRVLRCWECEEARIEAESWLRRKLGMKGSDQLNLADGSAFKSVLNDRVAKEMLARACVTVDAIGVSTVPVYGRIFDDGEEVARALTADELTMLFTQYGLVQMQFGPFDGTITEAQMDALIDRVVEGGDVLPLSQLAWPDLVDLIQYLCLQVKASRSSNGSASQDSPPSNSPSSSESMSETSTSGTGSSGGDAASGRRDGSAAELLATPGEVERLAAALHKRKL